MVGVDDGTPVVEEGTDDHAQAEDVAQDGARRSGLDLGSCKQC